MRVVKEYRIKEVSYAWSNGNYHLLSLTIMKNLSKLKINHSSRKSMIVGGQTEACASTIIHYHGTFDLGLILDEFGNGQLSIYLFFYLFTY